MNAEEIAALLLSRQGQPDRQHEIAARYPQQSLEVVAALKQHVDQEKLRNAHHALQIAEAAHIVAAQGASPEAPALALWARGNALYHLSRYQEALDCYQHAETLYSEQEQPLAVLRLQINQVAVRQDMGEFQAALALAHRARETCQALGEPAQRYLASLEMNAGAAYQQLGALEEALAAYERGRAIFTALHESVETARIDINRANVLQEMGRFSEAEALFLSARATLAESDQAQEVARADHNLGKLAYRRGQYQAALRFLEAAHAGFAAIPNLFEVATVNLYRSLIYRDLNLIQETITLAAEAERMFEQETSHWLRATALTTRGTGYQRLGAYARARELLTLARRIHQRQGAAARVLLLDVDRAVLALEEGRIETAQRLARRLVHQLDPQTWPALAARAFILLARCALARTRSNLRRASQHAERACEIATSCNLPERVAAYHVAGRVLEQAGDVQAAWQRYQAALQVVEQMRVVLPLDEFQMSFMDDKLTVYEDVVRLGQRLASPAQLLGTLNLAQTAPVSRLTSFAASAAAQPFADADLRSQVQPLRDRWHWYQSKLEAAADGHSDAEADRSPAVVGALRQQMHELEMQIADHVHRWQVRTAAPSAAPVAPLSLPMTAESAETFLHTLQQHLGRHDVLLHYFVVAGQFGAALVTPDHLHLRFAIAPAAALQRVLRSWRFHLEHAYSQASPQASLTMARAHLAHLYQALIAPLEPYLGGDHPRGRILLVVPPGWHDIPFAALFDGQRHMIERFQFAYLSAPEVLLQHPATASARPAAAAPHALIIGCSEDGRLPHVIVEARQVAQALGAASPITCLLEEEATINRLRSELPASHLLHLATHATFRPDNPLFSWIRLADARLTVADLYEMTLPQRPLVVLSACETGRGQPRGGGLLGMGRGFLAAGAAGLIVSLWKIDDRASAQVMADLYTHRNPAQILSDPAGALCQAQRLACARGEHPHSWAGFIFIQG